MVILRYLMLTLRIYFIIVMYVANQSGKIIIAKKDQHLSQEKSSAEGLIILARLIARIHVSRHLTRDNEKTRVKSDEHGSK